MKIVFKNYIFLFLLLSFTNANAGLLDTICNMSLPNVTEVWPKSETEFSKRKTPDSFLSYGLCPPYNKSDGRAGTCLQQFDYPGHFIGWYLKYCAENTPENTYFDPKIRVRYQACNFSACWTLSKSLSSSGECITWPTGYAYPLLRICARIASPKNTKTNTPADPGYEEFKDRHLNTEGAIERDKMPPTVDGQPIQYDRPKLCAYRDPSTFDLLAGELDIMDFNPISQPFHKTFEMHPIAKLLKFIIKQLTSLGGITDMLNKQLDKVAGDGNGQYITDGLVIVILGPLGPFLGILRVIGEQVVTRLIDEVGQINRSVYDGTLGCVELALGPYPPPYCTPMLPFNPTPEVQNICQQCLTPLEDCDKQGNDKNTGKQCSGSTAKCDIYGCNKITRKSCSTASLPCAVSKLDNNLINNSVRITINNYVPLCTGSKDPMKTDECVNFSNAMLTASVAHLIPNESVKPCSISPSGDLCVNTKIPFSCSVSSNGCENGFRIVYATKFGKRTIINKAYMDDLKDCPDGNNPCQVVWGINKGEFQDVALKFPETETNSIDTTLEEDASINDSIGNKRSFKVSIYRKPTYRSDIKFLQEANQMCVSMNSTTDSKLVGCVLRQQPTMATVSSSLSTTPQTVPPTCLATESNCTQGYYNPQFYTTLKAGEYSTSALVKPSTIYDSNNLQYKVNLAGYNFSSFVTDDTFIMQPFSGNQSPPNPTSIYGKYKNTAGIIDDNLTSAKDSSAIYLYGLEYDTAKYKQGGKFACLTQDDLVRCPVNTKNCVLAKLLNSDVINCSGFKDTLKEYPNLTICSSDTNLEPYVVKNINRNGAPGIAIRRIASTNQYCYESDKEICKVSINPDNRVFPAPSPDPVANQATLENQILTGYYDIEGSDSGTTKRGGRKYNTDIEVLRDKTPFELGMCVPISQPKCPAITSTAPNQNNGNATWTEAVVGTKSVGKCISGYVSSKPLERWCLSDSSTRTISFEQIKENVTGNCILPYCPTQRIEKRVICTCSSIFRNNQNTTGKLTLQYSGTPFNQSSTVLCSLNTDIDNQTRYFPYMVGSISCVKKGNTYEFENRADYFIKQCYDNINSITPPLYHCTCKLQQ